MVKSLDGMLKFNIDKASGQKSGPAAGIGGVLCDSNGAALVMFCKHIGMMESNV